MHVSHTPLPPNTTSQAVRSIFESPSSAAANTSTTDKDGNEEQAKATVVCKTPPPTWEYTKDENTAIASGEHELGCMYFILNSFVWMRVSLVVFSESVSV